ncbi:MAG: uL15 family ribosomal protein [Thermoplasmata archaeon]
MPSRTRRFRGSRTHGRGHKAGRGKGKRGGTGNAGLHKHRFKEMLKYCPDHFGRHGFKRPPELQERVRTINIGEVEKRLGSFLLSSAAKDLGGRIQVDLGHLGYDKLLGGGRATLPLTITVPMASARAVEKVRAAGGAVVAEEVTGEETPTKTAAHNPAETGEPAGRAEATNTPQSVQNLRSDKSPKM